MYISNETVDQTEKRLKKVIQTTDFRIFDKSSYFKEVPVTNFEFGSGVFVVCGQNTNKGGIFDYWGCPMEIETKVISFIKY